LLLEPLTFASWAICIMAPLPVPAVLMQYFHDQLLAFVEAHGPRPDYYLLKPIVPVFF
jgi:hypothetical protein